MYVCICIYVCMYVCKGIYAHKYILHYCFTNGVSSEHLDYRVLFCIRNNREFPLCEIFSDNREIAIISSAKQLR